VVVANPLLSSMTGLRSGSLKSGSLGNIYDIAGDPNVLSCEVAALKATLAVSSFNDQSGANLGCTQCTGAVCTGTSGGTAGQSGTFTGDAIVQNTADLAWLKNVVNLSGALHIDSSTLPAVSGLTNLKAVAGDLTIKSNASLSNVNGLSGLQSVNGNFDIESNPVLTNLNGLSALTGVVGYFQAYNNNQLSSVGGLSALATVGDLLNFQSNPSLPNVDGLANLTSVGANQVGGGGYLQFYSNAGLTSIQGVIKPTGSLAFLGNYLDVYNNVQLSSCQADALKAALVTAQSWNKVYTNGANLTCSSPKACAGAICQ
jgi:hypothetical protein